MMGNRPDQGSGKGGGPVQYPNGHRFPRGIRHRDGPEIASWPGTEGGGL